MDTQEALYEYSESLKLIKKQCHNAGMSEDEFKQLYFESLDSSNHTNLLNSHTVRRNNRGVLWRVHVIFISVILMCITYNFKTVYSSLICNLQDYVYPGLRLLRKISIPFISLFPSLAGLYHESCLIQNPLFTVADMDCWPCSMVSNVQEIHNPKPVHQQHNPPFIYETNQQVISLAIVKDLYDQHKNVFEKESTKILVNNKFNIQVEEMFRRVENKEDKNVYVWRFNNMNVARVLRKVVSRPNVVPKFGQSIERFIIIDSSQEQFAVPDTECNFSFILSLSGSRIINLMPAEECKTQCRSLKLELKETFLLWYNWWYWRPVIEPSYGNTTLLAYVGSYC